MSKFLAPIHTWLFNKIVVLEDIEKEILNANLSEKANEYHKTLQSEHGEFIPNQPLETIIDQSNIHGWLQATINIAEKRQAALIGFLIAEDVELSLISSIYQKAGISSVAKLDLKANDAKEIFNGLNAVLLEGMPCDRVNAVQTESPNELSWVTSKCVHKENWEAVGTPVEHYYDFRAAFSEGFVSTINKDFNYTNENMTTHTIKRK